MICDMMTVGPSQKSVKEGKKWRIMNIQLNCASSWSFFKIAVQHIWGCYYKIIIFKTLDPNFRSRADIVGYEQ